MFVRESAAPVASENDTSGCRAPAALRPCRRGTRARLALHLVVLERRAVGDGDLGDRVREIASRSPSTT